MADKPVVFLSWSGKKSQAVASVLDKWMQSFIQACKPWMSDKDIDVGKPWREELNSILSRDGASVGVFVPTRENQHKPWLLFEYGRLSADKDRVCPPLCCDLSVVDVTGPLAEQMAVAADKEGVLKMLLSIDKALGTEVGREVLVRAFDSHWVAFSRDLEIALETNENEGGLPAKRDSDAMIAEVLERVRQQSSLGERTAKQLDDLRLEFAHQMEFLQSRNSRSKIFSTRDDFSGASHSGVPRWALKHHESLSKFVQKSIRKIQTESPTTCYVTMSNGAEVTWFGDDESGFEKESRGHVPF